MAPTPQQMKVAELSSRVSEVSTALLDISKAESTTEKALTEQVSKLDIIAYDLVTLQEAMKPAPVSTAKHDPTPEPAKTETPVVTPTPPVVETPAVTPPPVTETPTTTPTPIK